MLGIGLSRPEPKVALRCAPPTGIKTTFPPGPPNVTRALALGYTNHTVGDALEMVERFIPFRQLQFTSAFPEVDLGPDSPCTASLYTNGVSVIPLPPLETGRAAFTRVRHSDDVGASLFFSCDSHPGHGYR